MATAELSKGQRVRLTDDLALVRAHSQPEFVARIGRFLGDIGTVDRVVVFTQQQQHATVSEFGSLWIDARLLTVVPGPADTGTSARGKGKHGKQAHSTSAVAAAAPALVRHDSAGPDSDEDRDFAVLQAFVDAGNDPTSAAAEQFERMSTQRAQRNRAGDEAPLAKGDLVRVTADEAQLRRLAEAAGDFDEDMLAQCGREGFVSHAENARARVAGLGRRMFPAAALERLQLAKDLVRIGDRVRLTQDLALLRGHDEEDFVPAMEPFLGKFGVAMAVDMRKRVAQVHSLGSLWYPFRALTREPVALLCPESSRSRPHLMQQFQAPHVFFKCDECKKYMARGAWLFGCREHNSDLCQACAGPKLRQAYKAAPRRRSVSASLSRVAKRLSGGSRGTAESAPQLQTEEVLLPTQFSCYLSVGKRADAQAVGLLQSEVSAASQGAVQLVRGNAAPRGAQDFADPIAASSCVVVALTPDVFRTPRCLVELAMAKAEGVPVVPVLLKVQSGAPAMSADAVRALARAKPMDEFFPAPQEEFWRMFAQGGAIGPEAALDAVRALPTSLPPDNADALHFGPVRNADAGPQRALQPDRLRAQARRVAEAAVRASRSATPQPAQDERIVGADGTEYQYHVFISHDWDGDNHARVMELVGALELRGVKVWVDENKLRLGDNLFQTLLANLQACKYVLLVATQSYVARVAKHFMDNYCAYEFYWAFLHRQGRILIAITDPEFRKFNSPVWGSGNFKMTCADQMRADLCEPALLDAAADAIAARLKATGPPR